MKPILWVLLVALAVVLVMINWPQDDRPKIDPALQRALDSSDATRPTFQARVDTLKLRENADAAIARAMAHRGDSLARIAARAKAKADSIAQDGAAWQAAYQARSEEATNLWGVVQQKDSAYQAEHSGRLRADSGWAEEKGRRLSLESLNGGLRSTIASLERPCRLIGPIPCPNRKTVGVLSALGGYLAGSAAPAPIRH